MIESVRLTTRGFRELRALHSLLWLVLDDVLALDVPETDLVVSSVYRTASEDNALGGSGVHTAHPHRAIDLAMPWDRAQEMATALNSLWEYDPSRPQVKVAVGTPHGSGGHLHLQVHPYTRRRPKTPQEITT